METPSPLPSSSSASLLISPNLVDPASPPISTSSHPQNPSQHSLPLLPIELKREILRFCDPSTLATTSLVSLAFLEMSAPLLYHSLVVWGWENVVKLFCVKTLAPPQLQRPEIDDYLSLEQIRDLTYIHLPSQQEGPPLSRSSPLPISFLLIEFVDHDGPPGSIPSSLLSLFNPFSLTIQARLPKSPHQLLSISLTPLVHWNRLQVLSIRNTQLVDVRTTQWFSSLERPLTIGIDVLDAVVGVDSVEGRMLLKQLEDITLAVLGWPMTNDPTWFGGVEVVLKREEEAEMFREKVNELKARWAAGFHPKAVEETFRKIKLLSPESTRF